MWVILHLQTLNVSHRDNEKIFCLFHLEFVFVWLQRAQHEFCGIFRPHPGWRRRHHLLGSRLHDAGEGATRGPNADALRRHSALHGPDRQTLRLQGHLQQGWMGPRAPPDARAVDRHPAASHADPLHHWHRHDHHDAGAEAGLRRLRVRWDVWSFFLTCCSRIALFSAAAVDSSTWTRSSGLSISVDPVTFKLGGALSSSGGWGGGGCLVQCFIMFYGRRPPMALYWLYFVRGCVCELKLPQWWMSWKLVESAQTLQPGSHSRHTGLLLSAALDRTYLIQIKSLISEQSLFLSTQLLAPDTC